MTDKFDPDWPHGHVTRDGRRARLMGRLKHQARPLVFAIETDGGCEHSEMYPECGRFWPNSPYSNKDLLNAPAPKRVWEGWAVWRKEWKKPELYKDDPSWIDHCKNKGDDVAFVRIEFPPEEPAR